MSTNNAIHTRLIYGILAALLLASCTAQAAPVSQAAQPTIAPVAPQQTQPTTALPLGSALVITLLGAGMLIRLLYS